MKHLTYRTIMFLVVLTCASHFSMAAPVGPMMTNSDKATTVNPQGELRTPMRTQPPGILPCPDQSRMTKEKDLAYLENHSRDCGPADRGAIRTQPDRPDDGEMKDKDFNAPMEVK